MRVPTKPLVALLATEFAYASLAPTAKIVVGQMHPITLAGIRVLVGGALLAAIALSVRKERVAARDLPFLALLALLGVVLNQGLFLLGLARTTASNASILIATIPIFTVLVAIVLRREEPVPLRILGIATALVGVGVLVRAERLDLGAATTVGDLMIVANSLSFSFYLVLSRPLLQRYRSTTVVMWTFLIASLVFAPWGAAEASPGGLSSVTPRGWLALAWVVLVGTVAAYALNNYALKRLDSSTVAAFVFLQPLIGVALAVALLGETVGWRAFAGGAFILAGLLIVARTEAVPVGTTDVGVGARQPPQPD